ncbi:MAG TPA: sigma-70 family RNA polymerase sigma factor [Candidatus Krumholzibacteria bacterium]|nr:sigma-70 family RNA polymerase sigma factor [Candidatus Krumholzibacteria bacterium]HPD71496.1 sigma-70 family RNA polymerase sigma factor [Candidatus Krumholzibacteria bacterium]HRY41571.1 sigma-70 family RNA polymerase sigma factor [Candidatus Krumholzibacteria bacterium]
MRDDHVPGPNGAAEGLKEMRDEDLIVLVQKGHRRAFDEIVGRYKGRLFSFTLRMVKDASLAEELTQETLIRVYMHAEKYREIARFSTWVFTIATNLVRNRMRQQSRSPRFLTLNPVPDEDEQLVDPPDPVADPSRSIESEELGRLISAATAKIPEKYRVPFLLREVEQLSYEEIQRATGLKLGTVRSRINRARHRFRQNVKPLLRNEALLAELERIEARAETEED